MIPPHPAPPMASVGDGHSISAPSWESVMSIETPPAEADLSRARAVLAALDDAAVEALALRVAVVLRLRMCRPSCRAAVENIRGVVDAVDAEMQMARDSLEVLDARKD